MSKRKPWVPVSSRQAQRRAGGWAVAMVAALVVVIVGGAIWPNDWWTLGLGPMFYAGTRAAHWVGYVRGIRIATLMHNWAYGPFPTRAELNAGFSAAMAMAEAAKTDPRVAARLDSLIPKRGDRDDLQP